MALDGAGAHDLLTELGALEGVERVEQVADPRELRARLYLTGDAPLLVAPVAAVVAGHRARSPTWPSAPAAWRTSSSA